MGKKELFEDGKMDEKLKNDKNLEKTTKDEETVRQPEIPSLNKKQRKQQQRMSIFELKMKSKRPDLVETWDNSASDPLFLLELKQVRNSVPVPQHWAQKRRYL